MLSFEVVPGVDPADVLNNLHLFRLAVSLGAVESLAELPCRMTHFELPREERLKIGITDELVRLAVGIEDANDLIEDLGQAFDIAYARYIDRHADFDVFQQLTSGCLPDLILFCLFFYSWGAASVVPHRRRFCYALVPPPLAEGCRRSRLGWLSGPPALCQPRYHSIPVTMNTV